MKNVVCGLFSWDNNHVKQMVSIMFMCDFIFQCFTIKMKTKTKTNLYVVLFPFCFQYEIEFWQMDDKFILHLLLKLALSLIMPIDLRIRNFVRHSKWVCVIYTMIYYVWCRILLTKALFFLSLLMFPNPLTRISIFFVIVLMVVLVVVLLLLL